MKGRLNLTISGLTSAKNILSFALDSKVNRISSNTSIKTADL